MNEVINKLLLEKDKCMPEMYFSEQRFIYGACGPFAKKQIF